MLEWKRNVAIEQRELAYLEAQEAKQQERVARCGCFADSLSQPVFLAGRSAQLWCQNSVQGVFCFARSGVGNAASLLKASHSVGGLPDSGERVHARAEVVGPLFFALLFALT